MIRPKLSPRRPLAAAGAVFLGLAAAVAVSGPASAHHPVVTGSVVCSSGEKVITWSVTHSQPEKVATVTEVKPSIDTPVEGINGAVLARLGEEGDTVTGTQRVPGDATGQADLTVTMTWEQHDGAETRSAEPKVDLSQPCDQAPPPCVKAEDAKYKHTFDGPKGVATVELVGDKPLCDGSRQDFFLISYFAPRPKFSVPQYAFGKPDIDWIGPGKSKIELKVQVPQCNTQVDLIWGGESDVLMEEVENGPRYGDKKLGSSGAPGNRSEGPQGWYNGGDSNCTTPAAEFVSQCDGTVLVNLSNTGELGRYPVDFTVTGEGGFSKKATVAPGKSEDGIAIPVEAAAKISVSAEGREIKTYSWTRPETCVPPKVTVSSDCDRFAVTVSNPKDNSPVTAEVAYGDKTEKVTVAPGGKESVAFTAGADTATVTFTGLDVKPLKVVYKKPATCEETPGLPVTGAAAGGIAAGAAVLLVVGAALFLVARRRRVRFTA